MSDPFDPQSTDDLSAFDDEAPAGGVTYGSDQDTIKAINKRTSLGTKIMALVLLVGVVGGGWFAYTQSQAYDVRMDVFDEAAALEDPAARNAALRNVLENAQFEDVKQRAIMNLGHFHDAGAVPLLIQALDDAGVVRRSAAWALAQIGSPDADTAKPKLLEVLPETTEIDRSQVVWTLAILRAQEDAAIEAIIADFSAGHLQSLDGFEPRIITDVLGVERLSSAELTGHEREAVRRLTAHALAEEGSPAVIGPLARMLSEEAARPTGDDTPEGQRQSTEVIRAAAAGLGRTGESAAARPLFEALAVGSGRLRGTILDALRQSTSATDLAVFVPETTDPETKRDLIELLVASHDRRVADTLASVLGDEDVMVRGPAALQLAKWGDDRATPVLFALTTLEDEDDLVSDAVEHLRYVATPEMVDPLAAMIETHPFRRAAILRALGATESPAAVRPIEKELEGDDMRAAALSLGDLNADDGFRTLLSWVVRPSNVEMAATNAADRSLVNEELLAKRRASIMAMGFFQRADALDELMTVVEDDMDDYELRGQAAAAIGQIADADAMATVIQKVTNPAVSDSSKRYYVQALWQRPHRELNAQLLGLLTSEAEPEVKRSAALALGYAADPANDERLMTMLDDPSPEGPRRNAAFAILLGGGDDAVGKLVQVLGSDPDLREVLQQNVMNEENDWFNLLTEEMFESGAIWRRLRAAYLLREGDGERTYSYPWAKTVAVLRTGWEGVGGVRPTWIRDQLWEAMAGEDRTRRRLAAEIFGDLPETGLLLRARDEGGEMETVARSILERRRSAE